MKGGVCYRHRSKSINAKNNLTLLQLNAGVTPATIPFRQSIEYEDEEELNSWIWKSSHGTRWLPKKSSATGSLLVISSSILKPRNQEVVAQK